MNKEKVPKFARRLSKSIDELSPLLLGHLVSKTIKKVAKKKKREVEKQAEYWRIFSGEEQILLKGLDPTGKEEAIGRIISNLREDAVEGASYTVYPYPYHNVAGVSVRGPKPKSEEELLTPRQVRKIQMFLSSLTTKSKKKVLKAFLKKGTVVIRIKDGKITHKEEDEEEEDKKPKPELTSEEIDKIKRVLSSLNAKQKMQLLSLFLGDIREPEEPEEKEPVLDDEEEKGLISFVRREKRVKKLRDNAKDLTMSSGTRRRRKPKPKILPASLKVQNTGRSRRNFNLIRTAQAEDKAIRERPMKEKLLRTRMNTLADKLRKTPFRQWKSQDLNDAQELLGEKTIRAIIDYQEKKK